MTKGNIIHRNAYIKLSVRKLGIAPCYKRKETTKQYIIKQHNVIQSLLWQTFLIPAYQNKPKVEVNLLY